MSNDLARDQRLTRRARGLFVELASHQEGWQTSIAKLADLGPEGTHAIRGAIEELEKYGYLVRTLSRDPKTSRVVGCEYWITDCPEEYQTSSEPSSENQTVDGGESSPSSEPSSENLTTAELISGQPISDGRTHKKTNSQKTTSKNLRELPPSSASPAPGGQQGLLVDESTPAPADPAPSSSRKPSGKRKVKERSEQDKARFDLAHEVATSWWERCTQLNIPNLAKPRFVGFRSMLDNALRECGEVELKWALEDLKSAFPSAKQLENAIARRRGVAPPRSGGGWGASGQPANHWAGSAGAHNPDDPHHEEIRRAFG
ncbi:hypothetical protein [Sinosporangium album]|uniref:hypothetical protein n=1 Tax=Sinosporangium album TaxID=504805 RepID=UPI00115FD727|nr:hypothetical protein [Sinosporangium album]